MGSKINVLVAEASEAAATSLGSNAGASSSMSTHVVECVDQKAYNHKEICPSVPKHDLT